MESRTLTLLEFPKVLSALAGMAVSEPGAEACQSLSPLDDAQEVRRLSALGTAASEWSSLASFKLTAFPSLDGLFAFAENRSGHLDADGLFALSQVLVAANEAREVLGESETDHGQLVADELLDFPWPDRLVSALSRCLDPEGRIRDASSPELYAVRGEIRQIHQKCTKKAKDFILSQDLSRYLQDDFITLASDRYVLPLRVGYKNKLQGIIHDYSQTGETCYFEPMFLVDLNNRLRELKNEEAVQEKRILEYLTGLFNADLDGVRGAYDFLVQLDVLMAKAALGRKLGAGHVELGDRLLLKGLRHPLLALTGQVQAVDVELGVDERGLIISGGNAGGKTVCLKAVGLAACMALSGLPVPALEGSEIPVFSDIFIVMGDEQSLEDNVSTFTAQIRYLSRVWNDVGEGSLFILDEFGAGTDPTQGAALAQAVMDKLMAKQATALAATHFPALKAYALAAEGMRAASVLFDPATKRPLYRLAYDQVGASIALEVAHEQGLPADILEQAEHYLLLDGSDTSRVLDRLNELAVTRERELDSLQAENERLKAKRAKLEERFQKERDKLLAEVRAQSQAVLHEWKEGKASRKQALKKLSQVREKLVADVPGDEDMPKTPTFSFDDLNEGDRVSYPDWGKTGSVVELDRKKQKAKVDFDGVAMWVDGDKLGPLSGKGKSRPKSRAVSVDAASAGPALVLDLRGRRADVALSELERFLDDAILRGSEDLEIVHGRGTGALRREVHDFLTHFPAVASFALADENRGGDGMTEVRLK